MSIQNANNGTGPRGLRQRVLVVEDEALVAILMEDMLAECGYDTVGPAANSEEAMRLIEEGGFHLAILDVNLGGKERVFEIARELEERAVPYVFVTGYAAVEHNVGEAPVIAKPFGEESLRQVLRDLAAET